MCPGSNLTNAVSNECMFFVSVWQGRMATLLLQASGLLTIFFV